MKVIIDRIDKVDKNQMNILIIRLEKMFNEKKMKQDINGNLRYRVVEKYPDNESIKLSHYYVANHQTVSVGLLI